jgi:transcriptional regulator with XRE-family HTH domain
MTTFGTRLHEERKRLKITQEAFANLGGVERNAQSEYENDKIFPKADYLMDLAKHGVDVGYLIYAERNIFSASQQEKELVSALISLPPSQQALGFIMLNLFRRGGFANQTVRDADSLWRGARLLEQFLNLSDADQKVLEIAANGLCEANAAL